jgi:acetyl esterase/lipase
MSTQTEEQTDVARRELAAVLKDIDDNPWPEDIVEARVLYDKMGPPIAADIKQSEVFEIGGMPAQLLTPPEADPDRALLFLHGGGYVYGSLQSHNGMVAEVARAARCVALAIQYRLAPEHPFPAALDDACAAHEWLLKKYKPEKLGLVGDSAGGGLVMSTLVTLRDKQRPLPGAVVCISPWVDLESKGESWTTRQKLDPMLDRPLVDKLSVMYLKDKDRGFPTVSTVNADLRGLPPMLVQVGEREVLFSEAELLARKAKAAGVDVTFEEWKEMVHVWHLYFTMLGAGRDAIARVGGFVSAHTGGKAGAKRNQG